MTVDVRRRDSAIVRKQFEKRYSAFRVSGSGKVGETGTAWMYMSGIQSRLGAL